MRISAISPATVHVILDYLCPLTGPLPPHLVSAPLLQRHHFLNLSPASPADYLAWPSPEQSHAVQLLQQRPASPHDLPLLVHYLPDPLSFQAHVRINSDLRLIFLWDKNHGWQYHNVALMPFPPNTYPSLDDALSTKDEDDSYWNAYGQGDDSDSDHHLSAGHLDPNASSEDAYWAQYSNIQGSDGEHSHIVPSDDLQTNHVELYNPLEPPPPASLARRLEALSSHDGTISPLFEDDLKADSNATIPHPLEPVPALTSSSSTTSPSSHDQPNTITDNAAQDVLKDNIKGLYRLWKLVNQDLPSEHAKEVFLKNTRRVLEEEL
ncbi:hypothetical protein CPB84DRAFT_1818105 [Gymnopilus junonius]|uniref:Uncharacterized protein n=1 Tax=Gymnopilus junonius TaxID=109634 RepID=A0A9P5NAK0_GYMJU|nr:hypothetical protein CPB84DRAFT_1818105 [Gymnopilus junonius]